MAISPSPFQPSACGPAIGSPGVNVKVVDLLADPFGERSAVGMHRDMHLLGARVRSKVTARTCYGWSTRPTRGCLATGYRESYLTCTYD